MTRMLFVCLVSLAGILWGQAGSTSCTATPEVAAALERAIVRADNPTLPFAERMAEFRKLLEQHPMDPFVNRYWLARFGGYTLQPLHDQELARYRAGSGDPAQRFLHALAMQRRDPTGSAATLEELPDSPWAHLVLAGIYARSKPADPAKVQAHLNRFAAICEDTLDRRALGTIAAEGGEELRRTTVARLRQQLPGRTDREAQDAWPVVWQMEFQLTPPSGHDALRGRIREDLGKLSDPATLRQGFLLVNDIDASRRATAELMRVSPQSKAAADATIEDWVAQNPPPDRSAPYSERNAYVRKRAEAGRDWVARWPNYESAITPLYTALFLEDLPKDEVTRLGRLLTGFIERNPDYTLGFSDAPMEAIADRLVIAGVALDVVPGLLERVRVSNRTRRESDLASAVRPFGPAQIEENARIRAWLTKKTEALLQWRTGHEDLERTTLAALYKEIAGTPGEGLSFWRGMAAVAEGAILAGPRSLAREAITRLTAALETERAAAETAVQKRTLAQHDATCWELRAKLAVAEARMLDAVAFYLRAMEAVPRNWDPVGRSRLSDRARETWLANGGTEEGWAAYRPQSEGASAQWTAVGRKMPEFALEDTSGRPVRLADLAKKTVFINVWATWCGPCKGELPWVQRLYEAVKDRPDVVVLTLNIDENPGVIARYMQERGFAFPVAPAREFVNDVMKVEAIPRNWIVDGEGVLRFERSAGFDDTFVKDTIAAMQQAKK